jgi:hypothetical protein
MRLLVVPIRYVSCLAAVVERAGGDATELLGSAKVDEASLEMPDAFISPRPMTRGAIPTTCDFNGRGVTFLVVGDVTLKLSAISALDDLRGEGVLFSTGS